MARKKEEDPSEKIKPLMDGLRIFAKARNDAVKIGLRDNLGAIHSIERIIDILGHNLNYPHLSHNNKTKDDPRAEISVEAEKVRQAGKRADLMIEHVMPQRAFAKAVIAKIDSEATDDEIVTYVRDSYRLVLLTPAETEHVNKVNRSRLTPDRIKEAEITLVGSPPPPPGG